MSSWRRARRRGWEGGAAVAREYGVKALAVACDVATAEGAAALVAATRKKFEGADILINNAGTGSNETIMEAPDEPSGNTTGSCM